MNGHIPQLGRVEYIARAIGRDQDLQWRGSGLTEELMACIVEVYDWYQHMYLESGSQRVGLDKLLSNPTCQVLIDALYIENAFVQG